MRISPRIPWDPLKRPTVRRTCSTGVVGSGPLVSRNVGGRLETRFFFTGRFLGTETDGESESDSPFAVTGVLVGLISSFNVQAHSQVFTGSNDHQNRSD